MFLESNGDDELFIIARKVTGSDSSIQNIEFDPVILMQPILAGSPIFSPDISGSGPAMLASPLVTGQVKAAAINNGNGVKQDSVIRIVRQSSIRLKFDPYYLFPTEITRVFGKAVSIKNSELPLSSVRIQVIEINDAPVVKIAVNETIVATGKALNGDIIALGAEKDISTLSNKNGDYHIYFSNETVAGYEITQKFVVDLADDGVPNSVCTKITVPKTPNSERKFFRSRGHFLQEIEKEIGHSDMEKYEKVLLKHAEYFIRSITIEASLEGFQTKVAKKEICSGQMININFELEKQ